MTEKTIFQKIRACNGRITKIKQSIVDILLQKGCLISQSDILGHLKKKKISPDRSTLFRELSFLTKNQIILKNTIADIDYYEIPHRHPHHAICMKCNQIDKVDACSSLKKQEKEISEKNNFHTINHSLEFYGYCQKCRI